MVFEVFQKKFERTCESPVEVFWEMKRKNLWNFFGTSEKPQKPSVPHIGSSKSKFKSIYWLMKTIQSICKGNKTLKQKLRLCVQNCTLICKIQMPSLRWESRKNKVTIGFQLSAWLTKTIYSWFAWFCSELKPISSVERVHTSKTPIRAQWE